MHRLHSPRVIYGTGASIASRAATTLSIVTLGPRAPPHGRSTAMASLGLWVPHGFVAAKVSKLALLVLSLPPPSLLAVNVFKVILLFPRLPDRRAAEIVSSTVGVVLLVLRLPRGRVVAVMAAMRPPLARRGLAGWNPPGMPPPLSLRAQVCRVALITSGTAPVARPTAVLTAFLAGRGMALGAILGRTAGRGVGQGCLLMRGEQRGCGWLMKIRGRRRR